MTVEDRNGHDEDGYARTEDHAELVSLLRALRPEDAQVVLLRFHDELSQDAIARQVGVSQMQVSRILRRSLARMRDAVV